MGCPSVHVHAQQNDSIASTKKKPKGFNALQYVNQGIWKGSDLPFSNKKWHDNIYAYAGLGIEGIPGNKLNLGAGITSYIGVGKDINKTNTVRLAFDYTNNGRPIGDPLVRWGISTSHLFNVSSYTLGYDPNRRIEFSTVVGAGYQMSKLDQENKSGFRGWMGIQAKFHATRHIDFALEPYIGINSYKLMMAEKADKLYQLTYGVSLNMRYKLHNELFEYHNRSGILTYGNFYSASIGAMMQLSDLAGRGVGPTISLGIGRWVVPGLGLKLTGSLGNATWHTADYTTEITEADPYLRNENTTYIGGRVEAVFEPFIFLKGIDEEKSFQLRLLAGGEFGKLWKKNYNYPISEMYGGPTAALQLAVRCENNKFFYIEPRFTMARYQVPYQRIKAFKAFADNLVNISIGMEISEPVVSRRRVNDYLRKYFLRKLLMSVEGGSNFAIFSSHYNSGLLMGAQAGIAAHYLLMPEHAVGARIDYSRIIDDSKDGKQPLNVVTAGLQYRLDATNAILGYDPDRRVSLALHAGPILSMRLKVKENKLVKPVEPELPDEPETPVEPEPDANSLGWTRGDDTGAGGEGTDPGDTDQSGDSDTPPVLVVKDKQQGSKIFIGLEAGFQIKYNISEYIGIYVAPQIRIYPSDFLPSGSSRFSTVASVSAGVQFKL